MFAKILKCGGNFLILDEPNDISITDAACVLEEALSLPGGARVAFDDRYSLDHPRLHVTSLRISEGDGSHHSVGDRDYYPEKKQRAGKGKQPGKVRRFPRCQAAPACSLPSGRRPPQAFLKEQRELEGMEADSRGSSWSRIEGLFADP